MGREEEARERKREEGNVSVEICARGVSIPLRISHRDSRVEQQVSQFYCTLVSFGLYSIYERYPDITNDRR